MSKKEISKPKNLFEGVDDIDYSRLFISLNQIEQELNKIPKDRVDALNSSQMRMTNSNFEITVIGSDNQGEYVGVHFESDPNDWSNKKFPSLRAVPVKGSQAKDKVKPAALSDDSIIEIVNKIVRNSNSEQIYAAHEKSIIDALNAYMPSYATILKSVDFGADFRTKTAHAGFNSITRKFEIKYNPSFVLQAALIDFLYHKKSANFPSLRDAYCYFLVFILCHEVSHVVKSHLTSVDASLADIQNSGQRMKDGRTEGQHFTNRVEDIFINLELGKLLQVMPFVSKPTFSVTGMVCEDDWKGTFTSAVKKSFVPTLTKLVEKSMAKNSTNRQFKVNETSGVSGLSVDSEVGIMKINYPKENLVKFFNGNSIAMVKAIGDIKYGIFDHTVRNKKKKNNPTLNEVFRTLSEVYRRLAKGNRLGLVSDQDLEAAKASMATALSAVNVSRDNPSDDVLIRAAEILKQEGETIRQIVVKNSDSSEVKESFSLYQIARSFNLFEADGNQPLTAVDAVAAALAVAMAASEIDLPFDSIPDPRERTVQDLEGQEIDQTQQDDEDDADDEDYDIDQLDSDPTTIKNGKLKTDSSKGDDSPFDSDVEMDDVDVEDVSTEEPDGEAGDDDSNQSSQSNGSSQSEPESEPSQGEPSSGDSSDSEEGDDQGDSSDSTAGDSSDAEDGDSSAGDQEESPSGQSGDSSSSGDSSDGEEGDQEADEEGEDDSDSLDGGFTGNDDRGDGEEEFPLDDMEKALDEFDENGSDGDGQSDGEDGLEVENPDSDANKAIDDLGDEIGEDKLDTTQEMEDDVEKQHSEDPDSTDLNDKQLKEAVEQLKDAAKEAAENQPDNSSGGLGGGGSPDSGLLDSLGLKIEKNVDTASDWRRILRNAMKKALSIQDVWDQNSPGRIKSHTGARQFGREVEVSDVKNIVFSIDYSGSMGVEEFEACVREMQTFFDISKIKKANLLVVYWSADPNRTAYKKLKSTSNIYDDIKEAGKNFPKGGTIVDTAVIGIPKRMPRPDMVVIFTDGAFSGQALTDGQLSNTRNMYSTSYDANAFRPAARLMQKWARKGQLLWVLTPNGSSTYITGEGLNIPNDQKFDPRAVSQKRVIKPKTKK